MWWPCRALLAALAVSCTLSRTRANGQSSQRLDRIKDLMCVLLLSGTQKEDLDASVLNKLQRYNVNIHGLNNNELLRECTTLQFLNNKNKTPKTRGIEDEINKAQNADNKNNLTNMNAREYDNFYKNQFENEDNKNKHAIQYKDGQPELKSVLKFWRDININNSIKPSEAPVKLNTENYVINDNVRPEEKNKRNVQDSSNYNESDTMKKLLLNYLLKSKNNNVDKTVTKKAINVDELYSDLYFLNKHNENKHTEVSQSEKTADISPTNIEAIKIEQYALNNIPRKNKVHPETHDRDSERQIPTQINSNNFNDIINAIQSFKTYYPIMRKDKSIENVNQITKERITLLENSYFNKFSERENILTTEKIITPKITEQKLSQNIIKEIANTVKELVLKDIRKEIFETTSYSTTVNFLQTIPTTTKRGELISTIKTVNRNSEQSILNKFIDLFEEIKTLNLKTLIISSEIRKESTNKEESTYPVRGPMFNNMEPQSYYKTKQYSNTNSEKIYDFSPQLHKFRSNVVSESVLQVPIKSTLPITVQTNNMEIPPLGIPVDKPENPINQNIIVPTIKPYRIGQYKVDHSAIKLPDTRIGDEFIPKQSQIRFSKPKKPNVHYSNHKNGNRFVLNNDNFNYNTNTNDKVHFNGYKESIHRGDENKHSDIPRFHEQLEKGFDYVDIPRKEYTDSVDCCNERNSFSKQMADCCNRKIASRQQMSLNNVKKQPSYDDTHFNNFLKSQQKVTDMLERILASRSKVQSVETA